MTHLKKEDTGILGILQASSGNGDDPLKALLRHIIQQVLEEELTAFLKAEPYTRTEERRGYRNGYKPRTLKTRVGRLELMVPKDREGRFQTELFEKYQRNEKALVLAIIEMYIQGVSTRKVKKITEELCGLEISKSQVSTLAKGLDKEVQKWRMRPRHAAPQALDGLRCRHRCSPGRCCQAVQADAEGGREIRRGDSPDQGYARRLLITDAAVNIAPDLMAKRDICQNAIDLAHTFQIEEPRVAILSAVETVNPSIQSTLDAAALCKMADRGQIHGGVRDGPLAMDNAINLEAARTKGITSPVAGQADVVIAPNLEAGNILAKQLTFMANADAAGIVLGARVPIVLTSRADNVRTRRASAATALLHAHALRRNVVSGFKR